MQTLEHRDVDEVDVAAKPGRRRSRGVAFAGAVVVSLVATAAIAYAIGSGNTKTEPLVNVPPAVTPKPAAQAGTKAPACIPGAAAGSCNTDEAKELLIPNKPLDNPTRTVLAAQLVAARAAALRYPTVADAVRGGMLLAGEFSPLTGAHYLDLAHATGPFDPSHPGSYIYDGTSPTSRIIGLMYLGADVAPPEGFAGPNDHWHRHANTCVIFGNPLQVPFPADSDVTKTQCERVHGTFMRRTIWMVHAWVVPGWDSPAGVFAHDNTDVVCADGTTKANAAGFCKGTA
jgi:hypothetical protein